MPKHVFYIDNEKQQYLAASWKQNWGNFELRFQDEVVCSFATRKELEDGRQFVMPDGHLLSVRLKGTLHPRLEVLRDGLPLSVNHAGMRNFRRTILRLALFLGILNITAGIAAEAIQSEIMLSIGLGYGSMVVGVVYLLMAWGIRHILPYAVHAIAAIIVLDILSLFVFTAMIEGPSSPASGMLIKLFLVYAYLIGVGALRQIRSQSIEKVK